MARGTVKVLAVDPGTRRIGLAVSDDSAVVALPLRSIHLREGEDPLGALSAAVAEVAAGEVVVGLPRRLDGSSGPEAKAARQLAQRIREGTGLKVSMVDERLTSVEAERSLLEMGLTRDQRRQNSDLVAATLILRTFLDRRRRPEA